jgi:hypothetical protein
MNEEIVMTATYASETIRRPAGLAETELAERLGLTVFDKAYDKRFRRHVWLVAAVASVGLLGAAASFSMLRLGTLAPHAVEFWLLCLVLAAGLLAIAVVVFAGSFTTHTAMVRIASLRRDTEASESIAEQEAQMARLEALKELISDYRNKIDKDRNRDEMAVTIETIDLILKVSDPNESEERLFSVRARVMQNWQRLGADESRIAALQERCRSGVMPSRSAVD